MQFFSITCADLRLLFEFTAKLSRKYRVPTHAQCPHCQHPTPRQYICYSQWIYTDPSLSAKFTVTWFTLGVERFVSLGKCMMTFIYHHSLIQNNFITLKILCALPSHLSFSCNSWWFYYFHSFTFSRMSCSWNHLVCCLFSLASFTY